MEIPGEIIPAEMKRHLRILLFIRFFARRAEIWVVRNSTHRFGRHSQRIIISFVKKSPLRNIEFMGIRDFKFHQSFIGSDGIPFLALLNGTLNQGDW